MLDLLQEPRQVPGAARHLMVIPRRRRVGGKRQLVGKIDARVELRTVGADIEIQNLRQQDDTVEVDVAVGLETAS